MILIMEIWVLVPIMQVFINLLVSINVSLPDLQEEQLRTHRAIQYK